MSKIQKIKCDCCEKELELGEAYYSGRLIQSFEGCDIGKQVLIEGDYCTLCFRQAIKDELK